MSAFLDRLRETNPDHPVDTWVFVPYDQLTDRVGPLAKTPSERLGVVLVETTWKPNRRRYHKQKLAWILSSQRHFALEQAQRGVRVRYLFSDDSYEQVLEQLDISLLMMEAAERELRVDLQPLVDSGQLEVIPHKGWLTTRDDFVEGAGPSAPWRMDRFYQHVRQRTGILMDDGSPAGGQYSHDGANRESWDGSPPAPEPPEIEPDAITEEVCALVESRFADHPGQLDATTIVASSAEADRWWTWAKDACMRSFGPYEDAMSTTSRTLFHTRISVLLNLHRLLPERVVRDVEALDIPLNSKEGFVRQVLGWREFVRHVHRETDGFRDLPDVTSDDAGALPNHLRASNSLPPAWWGKASGLACLDTVVSSVWDEGYSHHITRLMVLSNLALLLDVNPRELTDWFWVAYIDAFDWVVEPNVLGMGTFATGPLMTTKPYVSGAAYLNRMSDYCQVCAFHPKKNCPVTSLYWDFLRRHRDELDGNFRMRMPLASQRKRSDEKRARDQATFELVSSALARGEALTPDALADALS